MERLRQYTWVLGAAALACLVVFVALWVAIGELSRGTAAFGIAAGLLFSLFAAFDRDRLGEAASARSTRYEAGALVVLALGLAIFGAAMWLVRDHDTSWDLTRDHRHTLADASVRVLEGLDDDVQVIAFFGNGSPEQQAFADLIELAAEHTDRLQLQLVDPIQDALLARQFQITTTFGTVVLVSGESRQRLESDFREEALVDALVRLMSGEDHVVCWSTGHGESEPDDDFEADGMAVLVTKLEDRNFKIRPIKLLTEPVPSQCEALMIAGARTDLVLVERERLAAYVAGGGRVLLLTPPAPVGAGTPELDADLARYGVQVARDIVNEVDPAHRYPGVALYVYFGEDFVPHPITSPIRGAVVIAPPRSVAAAARDGLEATELLRTSTRAWAETNLDDLENAQPDEGVERIGEVPVMVAVEVVDPAVLGVAQSDLGGDVPPGPAPGGRLVVVGDATFASNDLVRVGNNQDIVLNAVAWLVDETDQLGGRASDSEADQLEVTELGAAVLSLVGLVFVPGFALLVAALVLLRRRFL